MILMAKTRIEHWKEDCIGCAACTVLSNEWVMVGDISHIKNSVTDQRGHEILKVESIGTHQDAADVCPVKCIKVLKLSENRVLISK